MSYYSTRHILTAVHILTTLHIRTTLQSLTTLHIQTTLHSNYSIYLLPSDLCAQLSYKRRLSQTYLLYRANIGDVFKLNQTASNWANCEIVLNYTLC